MIIEEKRMSGSVSVFANATLIEEDVLDMMSIEEKRMKGGVNLIRHVDALRTVARTTTQAARYIERLEKAAESPPTPLLESILWFGTVDTAMGGHYNPEDYDFVEAADATRVFHKASGSYVGYIPNKED